MRAMTCGRWGSMVSAMALVACFGTSGTSESAQPARAQDGGGAPEASVCGRDPVLQVEVQVEPASEGYEITVSPDPADLCADGNPSSVQWVLNDKTGNVQRWDIVTSPGKTCVSGGRNDAFSLDTARLGEAWFGSRTGRPTIGDCWAYDVLLLIGGEEVRHDPEIDWGS